MDEDVTFNPDDAVMRADEKECPFCHYLHFFWIACPTCFPLTKTQYEELSGGRRN